jgi:hypothetical protein
MNNFNLVIYKLREKQRKKEHERIVKSQVSKQYILLILLIILAIGLNMYGYIPADLKQMTIDTSLVAMIFTFIATKLIK